MHLLGLILLPFGRADRLATTVDPLLDAGRWPSQATADLDCGRYVTTGRQPLDRSALDLELRGELVRC